MKTNFLHNHPEQERILKIDSNHVIIDREDWEEARVYFGLNSSNKRRSGNTTRLVDRYIQNLFNGKEVLLLDHYQDGSKQTRDIGIKRMKDLVLSRLHMEHDIMPDDVIIEGDFIKLKI